MTPERKDLLDQLKRRALRALAKSDSVSYIEYVFGVTLADHHKRMIEFALDIIDGKKSGIILAPRGAGKTTALNTGLMSWIIAVRPAIRIAMLSQKAEKAEAMSGAIKNVLSETPESLEVFGNLRGRYKWTDSEWLRKDSPHYKTKDRTMVAAGADQSSSVVSKRFDVIFADDILDEINTYNIDRREKLESWFWRSLKPTQAAEGCAVLVVGTRWVEGDLYQKIIEDNKWPALVIPAITQNDADEDVSYWPEIWPLERLYREREDVGWDNFACSYLNDIKSRGGMIFQRAWWKDEYFDTLPADRQYVFTMGVDLASSEKERADWTSRAIVAEDDRHEHWVLHTARIKTEFGHREFVEDGFAWARTNGYPISRIIVETNQHQSTFVQDLIRNTNLPVVGKRTDTDKRTRARAAAARYESHRIHHHRSLRDGELENEMLGFPKGHDDLVDALGLALNLSGVSGAMATVSGSPRENADPAHPRQELGREIAFRDGTRLVPAHVAEMLTGIDTEGLSYKEATAQMNQKRLRDYVTATMGSFIPR
jgi:predicted phage terminase large subunit-like protein